MLFLVECCVFQGVLSRALMFAQTGPTLTVKLSFDAIMMYHVQLTGFSMGLALVKFPKSVLPIIAIY